MTVPLHWVAAAFEEAPEGSVLELGAGAGDLSLAWAGRGRRVIAVDRNPAVRALYRPGRLRALVADVRSLRPGRERFAVIHAHNVLQFLPPDDFSAALERLGEALKPSGLIALTVFSPDDPSSQEASASAMTFATAQALIDAFPGFEVRFHYEGAFLDEHAPDGVHHHGLSHVVLRKPGPTVERAILPGPRASSPLLGVGLSLRAEFEDVILDHLDRVDVIEMMTDAYVDPPWHDEMARWARHLPVLPHSVTLSVGTAAPPDDAFLARVDRAVSGARAAWHSDHLCYSHVPGVDTAALVPLVFSEEMIETVVRNVRRVKELVATPFLLENVSYYFPVPGGTMGEAAFIRRVLEEADIGMLLDVANLFQNAQNLGYSPLAFLDELPLERVVQLHIAGGEAYGGLLLDSHSQAVPPEVFQLVEEVLRRAPVRAIILERDEKIPPLPTLLEELDHARGLFRRFRR